MKKRIFILSLVMVFCLSLSAGVWAGDYTSSDPNKNNHFQRIYAKQYIAKYTVNGNPSYTDFTDEGGDCTNFASQVLYAGGMSKISMHPSESTRNWYNYSPTWIRAHSFRSHWGNVNNVGWNRSYQYKVLGTAGQLRANSGSRYDNLYRICSAGDIIQYVNPSNGKTWHSLAVHRRSDPNGTKKISMGQHTYNKWISLKDSLGNAGSDTIVCLIRVKRVQDAIEQ